MKQVLVTTALALACVAAFAQTPASPPTPGKPPESGAVPISPKAAAAAEKNEDARQAARPNATVTQTKKPPETGNVPTSDKTAAAANTKIATRDASEADVMAAMDTNGDGMISRKEYNSYHGGIWKKLKMKNGMATKEDVQAMLKQGGAR